MFTLIVDLKEEDFYNYICPYCGVINMAIGSYGCIACGKFLHLSIDWIELDLGARIDYYEWNYTS